MSQESKLPVRRCAEKEMNSYPTKVRVCAGNCVVLLVEVGGPTAYSALTVILQMVG